MSEVETKRGFKGVWIPKEIWLSPKLSLQEKVFLVEIESLDNEDGCFASNAHFAKFFGLSKGRVSQVIGELEKKKLITCKYIYGENKNITKRIVRVVRKLNTPIKKTKDPYLGNDKGSNTSTSNTKSNSNKTVVEKLDIDYSEVIDYLNSKADKQYRASTKKTQTLIKARVNEGFTVEDIKKVIDNKVSEWKSDKDMNQYLRPETLFGTKFEGYLNQQVKKNIVDIDYNPEVDSF